MAKAAGIARNATTRPDHRSDALYANTSAISASATGMIASGTHSGMPIGSIFGSANARFARTMSKAPLPRIAMTAADTEKPNSRERRRARPSPKISAVDSVRCLP